MCPWLVGGAGGDSGGASPPPDDGGGASLPRGGGDSDDEPVRAMPLVLRLERDPAPGRTPLLEAAATAALAVCLDERAAPGGPWHEAVAAWAGAGRIRKLARRARTAHWRAVQEVPGLTVARGAAGPGGAEVRALVPGPVDDVPHEVRRLQIGGTDLPADDPGPEPAHGPVVWLNPGVEQSTGKAAAQVGHATMVLAVVLAAGGGDPRAALEVAVRTASPGDWSGWSAALDADPTGRAAWEVHGVVPVRDAGFTEVAPGTVTCLARMGTA